MVSTAAHPANPRRDVIVTAASVLVLLAYCVALHLLIAQRTMPRLALALTLAPGLLAGLSIFAKNRRRWSVPIVMGMFGGVLWRFGDALAASVDHVLYFENLAFDLLLALVFAITLRPGREALVTRLARIVHGGTIPDVIVPYTRAVTAVWAIYFIALASISTLLFFTQSREAWSLFINVLVWPMTVALFAIEYAVRLRVLRDVDHVSLWATMRAFRHRAS